VAKAAVRAGEERGAAEAARQRAPGEALAELGLDNEVYSPTPAGPWRRAWQVTEALVAATAEEARRTGAGFALVTLTNGIQVHPDPAVRRAFARRLGVADLTYPDRRFAAIARRHGIPALTLAGPLRRLAEAKGLYLHGFDGGGDGAGRPDVAHWNRGHWNPTGHRAAGTAIADWLCGRLLAQGAAVTGPPGTPPPAPPPGSG
jgi:hypothetical protein